MECCNNPRLNPNLSLYPLTFFTFPTAALHY